jgi:hypothetical protein
MESNPVRIARNSAKLLALFNFVRMGEELSWLRDAKFAARGRRSAT